MTSRSSDKTTPGSQREEQRLGPLYDNLSIDVDQSGVEVTARIIADERHCNIDGIMHGGIVATLLDTALGFAVRATRDPQVANRTLEMHVSYFESARTGESVQARAHVERSTRRMTWAVASVVVVDDDGAERTIASGRSLNYSAIRPS